VSEKIKHKSKKFMKALAAVKRHPKKKHMDVRHLADITGVSMYTIYNAKRWLKALEEKESVATIPAEPVERPATPVSHTRRDTQQLVAEKGEIYGSPLENFRDAQWGKAVTDKCKDDEVRFALEMIWLKICRLVHTPDHKDTIDDIAGYAETIHMIHAERKRRG